MLEQIIKKLLKVQISNHFILKKKLYLIKKEFLNLEIFFRLLSVQFKKKLNFLEKILYLSALNYNKFSRIFRDFRTKEIHSLL